MGARTLLLLLVLGPTAIAAHGQLLRPGFRSRQAIGSPIQGYYVYWPYKTFEPTCVQGHCFGPTSYRCKDTAAETPVAVVTAGAPFELTIRFTAFRTLLPSPDQCRTF